MKKILFLLVCIFSIKVVNADTLNYENLPYYVLVNNNVIQIKKISDNHDNTLFNIVYKNYNINDRLKKYEEVNKTNYGIYYKNLDTFNTITYYAYQEKSDLNYFLTQVLVWNLVSNSHVSICDSLGNVITDYDEYYKKLYMKVTNHNLNANFHNRTYNSEIWNDMTFTYYPDNVILDNPVVDGLKLSNANLNLNIYNEKVGEYTLIFNKNYEKNTISYTDGINYYWTNLGGPADLEKKFYYNVYGTKLTIKENLIGINNKYGDATLNSSYELYLDDELKLNINNLEENYVKSNSNYILKDISENNSVNRVEDIKFNILNEEFELIVDKYVVSKNISIDIKDNHTYYVYLKSNNELYETIDLNASLITLPYGIYYVTDKNDYYEEIEVLNNIDEVLIIDTLDNNDIVVETPKEDVSSNDNEIVKEKIDEEISNIKNENIALEEDSLLDNNFVDEKCENPKTGYNYNLFNLLIFTILVTIFITFNMSRKNVNKKMLLLYTNCVQKR